MSQHFTQHSEPDQEIEPAMAAVPATLESNKEAFGPEQPALNAAVQPVRTPAR